MSRTFTLEQLAEGIRGRDVGAENSRLVEKWSRTGLLRGLEGTNRENMARLLENQTANLLRESNALSAGGGNSMSASGNGDIRGFSNIAFPIVRRVFGGLVANELVSIQPMSLPSGLLFYLDYTYGTNRGGASDVDGLGDASTKSTYTVGQSIYNNPTGKGIQSGSLATGGMYDLAGTGYSRIHVQTVITAPTATGSFRGSTGWSVGAHTFATGTDGRLLGFDPQVTSLIESSTTPGGGNNAATNTSFKFFIIPTSQLSSSMDQSMVKEIALFTTASTLAGLGTLGEPYQGGTGVVNLRRLNQIGNWNAGTSTFTPSPISGSHVLMVVSASVLLPDLSTGDYASALRVSYPIASSLDVESSTGSTVTIPVFESNFGTNPSPVIPEIDIKIESIAVTATTRKLRARWSPELAQDLNAYHSIDAEVELTQILSEQIALELDREILNDLLTQANGANYFWSRAPGRFVNKTTGAEVGRTSIGGSAAPGPNFTGTVREWYETLTETIIDVANEIHRKTLRGSANFIVVGPDVATILEASTYYRPSYSIDGSGQVGAPFSIGAEKVGTLSNRFTVYKDPYFPRNKILVGFKGGSYLETGYVYAPYVPLIVTPTIFAPEDFTPRKGVMTRYGKKMVRSDFYGTVTCLDMNII
jgi:hypothetical protein